jgi:hypothetical protein
MKLCMRALVVCSVIDSVWKRIDGREGLMTARHATRGACMAEQSTVLPYLEEGISNEEYARPNAIDPLCEAQAAEQQGRLSVFRSFLPGQQGVRLHDVDVRSMDMFGGHTFDWVAGLQMLDYFCLYNLAEW